MATVGNLTIGIKLALDNREMSGNLAISRDQLRAFAADMKRAADAGSGAFGATRTALKSISTQLADQVQQVNARLQLAVSGAREFAGAQRFAYRVAAQTGAGFEAVAALYGRLAQAASSFGLSQEQIARTAEATALALKVSGASAAEAASVVRQFSQALGSGVLRGDEFNSDGKRRPPGEGAGRRLGLARWPPARARRAGAACDGRHHPRARLAARRLAARGRGSSPRKTAAPVDDDLAGRVRLQ